MRQDENEAVNMIHRNLSVSSAIQSAFGDRFPISVICVKEGKLYFLKTGKIKNCKNLPAMSRYFY